MSSRTAFQRAVDFGKLTLQNPGEAWSRLNRRLTNQPPPVEAPYEPEVLLDQVYGPNDPVLSHVGYFTNWNAGDTLLAPVLRDLIYKEIGPLGWQSVHAHPEVTPETLEKINRTSGVIIGGGGLFLRDTNPNGNSGWQWNCSIDMLRAINVPMAVFAVGYNRFRGQEDFAPIFREHVTLLAEKAVLFGMRNHGSIRNIREYLPDHLREKVVYQPCMTVLLSRIYEERFAQPVETTPFIALNCAFDRADMRFGDRKESILTQVATAVKRLSTRLPVKYYTHSRNDDEMLPYLDKEGVAYEYLDLCRASSEEVLDAYRKPALTLGMRGHAQMVPFGCQRPILSLVSHDKMRWFLEDIDCPEWGIEMLEEDLAARLEVRSMNLLEQREQTARTLAEKQQVLWERTQANLSVIQKSMCEK